MPSTSAKINFLLGLEERTPRDAQLGKVLNNGNFKEIFLDLTSKSKAIRQPNGANVSAASSNRKSSKNDYPVNAYHHHPIKYINFP